MTQIISQLSQIAERYDALFVDLWGCVHNGIKAYPAAVAALEAFRQTGGKVVLVTNAPRSRASVAKQLEGFGIPQGAYDTIATSGDSARAAMYQGAVGERVFFIGETRDETFFEPLALLESPTPITCVSLAEAEGIICTGPFDSAADPTELRPILLDAKTRGLKLLCANPDIVVDRGETREWCAGAVAELYTQMGGESLYFGKPHPPIYDLARRRLLELGTDIPDTQILAIGDGIVTDIAGALGEDIDCLFITGGLAARDTKTAEQPDPAALDAYLSSQSYQPQFAIGFLR